MEAPFLPDEASTLGSCHTAAVLGYRRLLWSAAALDAKTWIHRTPEILFDRSLAFVSTHGGGWLSTQQRVFCRPGHLLPDSYI
jgi:hypothetical protein